MRSTRLIARLDVKGTNLIKGVHLEGLRVIGAPNEFAKLYYEQGADELIYIDVVASLYGRNSLNHIVEDAAKDVFVPMTVGGGIRSVDDAIRLLRSGGDIARRFGSQCMVLSVEAKRVGPGRWEAFTDNGREATGLDVVEWVKHGVALGAGEILLTSVDREGTRKGFDIELVAAVTREVSVPVIASGGMGSAEDAVAVVREGQADAVAMADILHYRRSTIGAVRRAARAAGMALREFGDD